LKPEDETTEEIFKESIEIENKPELEEVKLDITVDKTITETVTEVSEITTESVEEVDFVGPEEEVIATESEILEITEKPEEKEEIIIEQPEEKPIEKVEEKPVESLFKFLFNFN
jgi:hypothetical protein